MSDYIIGGAMVIIGLGWLLTWALCRAAAHADQTLDDHAADRALARRCDLGGED